MCLRGACPDVRESRNVRAKSLPRNLLRVSVRGPFGPYAGYLAAACTVTVTGTFVVMARSLADATS
jgi:hypothetical protein